MYVEMIKNNREVILTGEIGALLHDIGKCHPNFIESKSVEKTAPDIHAQIYKFLRLELVEFIKSSKFDIKIGNETSDIYNLITQHHPDKNAKNKIDNIVKILIACDHKDSADDKGIVRKKQRLDETWIASPFGYEKEKIDLVCLQKRFDELQDNLTGLFRNYLSQTKTMDLSCLRESLINNLRTTFSHALGETRKPANDVTLWDHSHSTASLFKSVLAGMVCGANLDPENLKWRIFGICWNGEEFINKGRKIAEIQKRAEIIDDIKGELKRRFEDEIPIGNAIYEDTNGIYFTFPELSDKSKDLARECAEETLGIIHDKSDNELWPFFTLSKASGTLTIIADEITFASEKRKIPRMSPVLFVEKDEKENDEKSKSKDDKESKKQNEENKKPIPVESDLDLDLEFKKLVEKIKEENRDARIDICPICRIRPKHEEAERCEICEKRRMGRLEQWLSNRQDTIWIEEVADKNNRIALISLSVNLDKWLDGTMIGSIYSQSFEDWYESRAKKIKENTQFMKKIKKSINRELMRGSLDELAEYFMEYFIKEVLADPEFTTAQDNISLRAKIFDTFFEDIRISEKDRDKQSNDNPLFVKNVWKSFKEKLDKVSTNNALSLLFTQNPSPARLYRIWKETGEFFDLIIRKIKDEIYSHEWKRIKFSVDMDKFYWFNWDNPKKEDIVPLLKSLEIIEEDKDPEIERDNEGITIKTKKNLRLVKEGNKVKLEAKGDVYEFAYHEDNGRVYRINDTTPYIIRIDDLEPKDLLVFHTKEGEFYTIESIEKFKFKSKEGEEKTGEESIKEALKQGFDHLATEDKPNENLLKKNEDEKIRIRDENTKIEVYMPLIEINRSPLSLRLIVPAMDCINIIELITKLYNERFEKVIGKLPLNMKLLVANRKFPLYVLLDAERRMLEGNGFRKQVAMNPWWSVDSMRNDSYYGFYPVNEIKENEKKYTLDDLYTISKDKIFFLYPGYFDFDLLLGTTDRYKIGYSEENDGIKRADKDYRLFTGRPYYFYQISEILELWDVLSANIPSTQINFIEEMLTSKLKWWRDVKDGNKRNVFRKFAEATLKDAFRDKWSGLRDETRFFLIDSATNGLLLDTIIFFRHVIKKEV